MKMSELNQLLMLLSQEEFLLIRKTAKFETYFYNVNNLKGIL